MTKESCFQISQINLTLKNLEPDVPTPALNRKKALAVIHDVGLLMTIKRNSCTRHFFAAVLK